MVQSFGEELTKKRGVKLDSFMFDDGWDDPTTLWKFNPGFPDGLTKVIADCGHVRRGPRHLAFPVGRLRQAQGTASRLGPAQGFETNEGGLALSGPKYYKYFRDTCLDMIANTA